MFRRSLVVVVSIIALVFASSFASQMMLSGQLPSAYDPGITVSQAFESSDVPLLIEFYTDSCTSCRMVTPLVHRAHQNNFHDDLTMVMVDVDNPNNQPFAQLFGIETVPALFVFDHKHMKKEAIAFSALQTPKTIASAVSSALANIHTRLQQP